MNSIKNAIVTVTLLAVGYGAYVVLNNPPQRDFDDFQADRSTGEADLPTLDIEIGGSDVAADSTRSASPLMQSGANVGGRVPVPAPRTLPAHDPATTGQVQSQPQPESQSPSAWEQEFPAAATTQPPLQIAAPADQATSDDWADVNEQPAAGNRFDSQAASPEASTAPATTPTEQYATSGRSEPLPEEESAVGPIDVSLGAKSDDATSTAPPSTAFEETWQRVQGQLSSQELVQALTALSPWHDDPTLNDEQRSRCQRLLDQLAGTVIYSREHLLEPAYEVQAGETLEEIAGAYSVPAALLAKINGIAPPLYALTTGEQLKVVRGPFRAEVDVASQQLTLFLGSRYAGRFSVRLGQDLPSQDAFYEVAEKSEGRSYFDRRSGQQILKGEASNRYGDHWLGLRGDQITAAHRVGIHGRPGGGDQSDVGSISLDASDADDVYTILSIGSRVQILR